MDTDDLYEVHTAGRIYVFDDQQLYRDFVAQGHTPYIITRIGDGPAGETVVFGLRNEDKKKRTGIGSVALYDGTAEPDASFYGETRAGGRIYVFNDLQEMQSVRETGEAPYRYTMIGAGPAGETVVLVLPAEEKSKKPKALIEEYRRRNHG